MDNLIKDQTFIICYTDGGYKTNIKNSTYGIYATIPVNSNNLETYTELECFKECGLTPTIPINWGSLSRQISGELYAVYRALYILKEKEFKGKVLIVTDYTGVKNWYTRDWKLKSDIARIYNHNIHNILKDEQISFCLIKGHKKQNTDSNIIEKYRRIGNATADKLTLL